MMPVKKVVTPFNASEIRLGDDDIAEIERVTPSHLELKQTFSDMKSFSKSSTTKQMLAHIELEKKRVKFQAKMSAVLMHVKALKLDEDQLEAIIVMVAQSAEDYLYCPDEKRCTCVKDSAVVELLKDFVKGDEVLCRQMIKFLSYKVKKSTLWRRNKKMVSKAFFFVFGTVLQAL